MFFLFKVLFPCSLLFSVLFLCLCTSTRGQNHKANNAYGFPKPKFLWFFVYERHFKACSSRTVPKTTIISFSLIFVSALKSITIFERCLSTEKHHDYNLNIVIHPHICLRRGCAARLSRLRRSLSRLRRLLVRAKPNNTASYAGYPPILHDLRSELFFRSGVFVWQ